MIYPYVKRNYSWNEGTLIYMLVFLSFFHGYWFLTPLDFSGFPQWITSPPHKYWYTLAILTAHGWKSSTLKLRTLLYQITSLLLKCVCVPCLVPSVTHQYINCLPKDKWISRDLSDRISSFLWIISFVRKVGCSAELQNVFLTNIVIAPVTLKPVK